MQVLVGFRDGGVGEWRREAVNHVAEDIGLAIGADDLCHTSLGNGQLVRDVYITVLSHAVFLYDTGIIDMYVIGCARLTHDNLKV